MKKFLSLLLVLILCLSLFLTSCQKEETPKEDPATTDDPNPTDDPAKKDPSKVILAAFAEATGDEKTIDLEELFDPAGSMGSMVDPSAYIELLLSILPEKCGISLEGLPTGGDAVLPGGIYYDNGVIGVDMGGGEFMYLLLDGDMALMPSLGVLDGTSPALLLSSLSQFLPEMPNDPADVIAGVKDRLKEMGLTEITLKLPALEESMLTEGENGYYLLSNTYVENCIKALFDIVPESVLEQNPEVGQSIAAAKMAIGGMLTNLGLKVELRADGEIINGVKVSVNSNQDFATLVGLKQNDKIAACVELLADAAGEKLEKFSVDVTLAGDTLGNGTFSLAVTESTCRLTVDYTGTVTEIAPARYDPSASYEEVLCYSAHADLTLKINVEIDANDPAILKAFSVKVEVANPTYTVSEDGMTETPITKEELAEVGLAGWADSIAAAFGITATVETAEGRTVITVLLDEGLDKPETLTVTLYNGTLPDTFTGLGEEFDSIVEAYKTNREEVLAAKAAIDAYVKGKFAEGSEEAQCPFLYQVSEDTYFFFVFYPEVDSTYCVYREGTVEKLGMEGAIIVTEIAEDGTLRFA